MENDAKPMRMDVAGASQMSLDEVRALVARKKGGRKKRMIEAAGGERAHDPVAFLSTVEQMRIAAKLRPPEERKKRKRSKEINFMTMAQVIEATSPAALVGELVPAAPVVYPAAPRNYQESEERLRDMGLDEVLALVEEGHSEREICLRVGTRPGHLKSWIASIPEGASRMRESRLSGAQAWLDRALAVIEEARTLGDLAKARELSAICRKYAAIYNPSFSDRVQVDTMLKAEDPGSIDAKLRLLVNQVAQNTVKKGQE